MSKENKTPSAEIIQGPWGKSKRKVKLPDTNTAKVQENLAFADDLTETLMVQLIHTMHENGFDVNGQTFVKSMGFVIESVKASIYKEMSLNHPMNRIMDILLMIPYIMVCFIYLFFIIITTALLITTGFFLELKKDLKKY